ncbi:MAG: GNAT family N-acetyltransferase [Alphaproteobacteria bacterium]|nr:GNAT family N-acetyltransferase [Alphaproteobacteria bacterium]
MPLYPVTDNDLTTVAAFVNAAYRGESSRLGWTTEADFLGGQRTDAAKLRADLEAQPEAMLLTLRDSADGPLLGCVWLEPAEPDVWYLGMLTVRPDLQDRQLGRGLLAEAEAVIRKRGARRVRMTVVNIRDTLIAWYVRRGYEPTGETRPFPYGDIRCGEPRRDDLHFIVLEKQLRD